MSNADQVGIFVVMSEVRLVSRNLHDFSFAEIERLAHIEFLLLFTGAAGASQLEQRFKVSGDTASKDIGRYHSLQRNGGIVSPKPNQLERVNGFEPLFKAVALRLLSTLTQGYGDGLLDAGIPEFGIETAPELNTPDIYTVAGLTTAVISREPIRIAYVSFASGETERVIVPHAIANNGSRWHVRAFDRNRGEFRDFVFNRILSVEGLTEVPSEHELADADSQWNEMVELMLIPHPAIPNPTPIELDHGMVKGERRLTVRRALAGYCLAHWSVDCSPAHSLDPSHFRLGLKNLEVLSACESADLAPGFVWTCDE